MGDNAQESRVLRWSSELSARLTTGDTQGLVEVPDQRSPESIAPPPAGR